MPLPEFLELVGQIKRDVREIDVQQLRQMQEDKEDFSLIDVREPEETQQGTIPGAALLPRGVLELKIDQVTSDKERKIVLYCAGGNRSALAAYMLQRMGFRNVLSVIGGYSGWKQTLGR
ncbi:MAG: rhodanese-like domain-containing protein [Acidobacteriota bacterium]|nr:rhodanese-like domain-containing protein [Acidobacteriota bacterium]